MKKRIIAILVVCLFNIAFVPELMAHQTDEISVYLNGERLEFDVMPQIIDGRTMVPMRVIFEALGAEVEWRETTQEIIAKKRNNERRETIYAELRIDRNSIEVFAVADGVIDDLGECDLYYRQPPIIAETIMLDAPPKIMNGRTLVPLRAVSEIFGAEVAWDADNRTVTIETRQDSNSCYWEGWDWNEEGQFWQTSGSDERGNWAAAGIVIYIGEEIWAGILEENRRVIAQLGFEWEDRFDSESLVGIIDLLGGTFEYLPHGCETYKAMRNQAFMNLQAWVTEVEGSFYTSASAFEVIDGVYYTYWASISVIAGEEINLDSFRNSRFGRYVFE